MRLSPQQPTVGGAISLGELKNHLRIDGDTENSALTVYMEAAEASAMLRTGRQYINTTYTLKLPYFPSDYIELPRPPLSSVTSISYVDLAGNSQTWSSSLYDVITDRVFGRVQPKVDETWPTAKSQDDAVTVTYVAGYGATSASVPQNIRNAILMLAADYYENRESVVAGVSISRIPNHIGWMLDADRVPGIAGV